MWPASSATLAPAHSPTLKRKVNGTKQLSRWRLIVIQSRFHRPFATSALPAKSAKACHTPARFVGEKLLVKSSFADDKKNTETQSVVVLHLGGVDSFSHLPAFTAFTSATSNTSPLIPPARQFHGSERTYPDGSKTAFAASALKGAEPKGERRVMDCIDCHNRAAHTMQTAEDALNRAMAEGAINPESALGTQEGS